MAGWIKLHRAIDKWGWKTDPNTMALWIHLLVNANYETCYFLGHEIPAGSLPTGLPSLAERTGLTVSQVRTSLNKLKMTGEIAVKVTPKFSIISITKWCDYQADDRHSSSPIAGGSQANSNTIRNKEIKNIRNKNIFIGEVSPKPKRGVHFSVFVNEEKVKDPEIGVDACPDDFYEVAKSMHLSDIAVTEWSKFHDYWIAQTGSKSVKADWLATWRNWLRNSQNFKKG